MWRAATSGSGWRTVSVSRQRTTRFDVNLWTPPLALSKTS